MLCALVLPILPGFGRFYCACFEVSVSAVASPAFDL